MHVDADGHADICHVQTAPSSQLLVGFMGLALL